MFFEILMTGGLSREEVDTLLLAAPTPFPNDFFRWSCLEMLLFSSSSRFDEKGLEEWTFSCGRVLERVSYFTRTKKNIVLIEFVALLFNYKR